MKVPSPPNKARTWLLLRAAFARRWLLSLLLADRTPLQRYSIAALVVVVSLWGTIVLESVLPGNGLYTLNLESSLVAAALGGFGPGVMASIVEALAVDYLWVEPQGEVFDSWGSILRVTIYVGLGVLTSTLVSLLKTAVSAQLQARREAEAASRAKENVLAIVTHDLRNPLSAITLSSDILTRIIPETDERAAKHASGIRRSAARMERQISDLLDAVKIEKGTFRLEPSPNEVMDLVEEALESVAKPLQERQLQVRTHLAEGLPRTSFDSGRILQCLVNLLSNAAKFSPHGTTIDLEVGREGEEILFRVSDQGPGVPPDERVHLFERFWQSEKTAHQGTGLGLFITKSIVQAHGGRVGLAEREGAGSTFWFSLPVNGQAEGPQA